MFWLIKFFSVASLCLLVSCGGNKSESSGVPTAPPEPTPLVETSPIPVAPTTDSRLPNLSNAVSLNLTDKINYSGLNDLAGNVFLPLVGDPKLLMYLPNSRSQTIGGSCANTSDLNTCTSVLVAFEDKQGFWGAQLPLFDGTGFLINGTLDAVFADDDLVVRVIGTATGGTVYYRLRVAADTQCKRIQTWCDFYNIPVDQQYQYYCPPYTGDTATPCRTYMGTTDTHVKKLGTYTGSYLRWATLPEGQ